MSVQAELCARIAHTLATAPIHEQDGYEALAYLKLLGPDYRSLLGFLHKALQPKLYVEIGVRDGETFCLTQDGTRRIGIDPAPLIDTSGWANTVLAHSTSDSFFAHEPNREKCRGFDLAFIDGDHSFDQALRDFRNLEALAKPTSIICIHDVIPMDARTATPKAETAFHTGDVWRLMAAINAGRYRDLVSFTVACAPTGLGIVGGFGRSADECRESFGMICGGATDVYARQPLDMNWDVLAKRLKIVPNNGQAIGAAFLGLRA
jgi:hypothetical protein